MLTLLGIERTPRRCLGDRVAGYAFHGLDPIKPAIPNDARALFEACNPPTSGRCQHDVTGPDTGSCAPGADGIEEIQYIVLHVNNQSADEA